MLACARSMGIIFSWFVLQLVFVYVAEAAVGRTPGTFDVSATGAATYQIPIWVPPGPKGLQPALALSYNSQSGNGLMGPGWSLAATSAIARCNRTYAQDAAPSSVALTTSDAYCIDGQRLRITSNPNTYGLDGSTYQTEVANFSLVTAKGTLGNGPAHFIVKGKDGLTYEYGATADSKVWMTGMNSVSTVYQWMLDKVTDRSGNSYSFTYTNQPGGSNVAAAGIAYLTRISWSPVTAGSTSYQYSAVFSYGSNTPAGMQAGWVANNAVINPHILSSVTIQRSDGSATLRRYMLGYDSGGGATGAARLTSVKECSDAAASDCLAPTTMTYQDDSVGVSGSWSAPVPVGYSAYTNYPTARFDFDGDGRTDLASFENSNWVVHFSNGSGFGTGIATAATTNSTTLMGDVLGQGKDGLLANKNGIFYYYYLNGAAFVGVSTGAIVEAGQILLADVNGDGLPDLVRYDDTSHILSVRLNTSGGVTPSFAPSTASSVNFCNDPSNPGHCSLLSGGSGYGPALKGGHHRRFDFNGDGREDLIWQFWNANYTYSQFGMFVSNGPGYTWVQLSPYGEMLHPYVGDFNDDGCDDIAGEDRNPYGRNPVLDWYMVKVYLSSCSGITASYYAAAISSSPSGTHDVSLLGVMDWNGDGKTDLLIRPSSTVIWNPSGTVYAYTTGSTQFSEPTATPIADPSNNTKNGYYFPIDLDGDGQDELGFLQYSTSYVYFSPHNSPGKKPDLLTSITDGYGVTQSLSHRSLVSGPYTKGPMSSAYTDTLGSLYSDWTGPLYVVSSVTASDGAGGNYMRSYTYSNAWQNLQGRGFSGFGGMQVVDSRANAPVVKTSSKTVFPYTGMVYQQDVYQNNGTTLISRTVNTPALTTLDATAKNQRYFPYVASSAADAYEVGGVKNGVLIAQSSASFTYDNYGNLTNSTSTVTDKDNAAPASLTYNRAWTTATTNTISPNTADWCLGLPTQTTVTNSATSIAAITRTTSYTPDYVNCRMTRQVVEPASSLYKVTTDLAYDGFGNVNSKTVTGINMAARVTTVNWGATGQFPVSVTNALNQTTQAGYDYNKGVQTSQTDPNNLTTSWEYDSFNRKTLEARPDATSTSWSYNDCASVSGGCQDGDPIGVNSINKMVVIATSKDAGGAAIRDDWTYFDQLDRSIVTKSKTLSGAYSRVGVQYDFLGRKLRETAPCDAASCSAYWNTYSYDALNRVTQFQRPVSASNSTLQTTAIAYQGMTTVTTDPQGKQTTKVLDPSGRLRRSKDANGYYQDFSYDAFGSLKGVTDQASNSLFYAYYGYGINAFQTQTIDMDLGTWVYTPNALGEVTNYTDARGSAFSLTYDKLSRPVTRFVSGEGTTTWTWGNTAASFNIGQLQSLTNTVGTTENYIYDNKGRLSQRQIVSDATYNYNYTYNAATGLLDTVAYPTSTGSYRLTLKYLYQYGLLTQMKDNNGSMVFWQANAMNPRGQITQETLGNGIVTNRGFDAVTGWLNSIQSGMGGGAGVQNEAYLFDKVGNVTQRQNNMLGLTENFYYDNVYRLDYSQLNGVTNLDLTYNNLGNITNRTDVASNATWTYHATKKHAVTQAGSSSFTYTYDANGNAITRNGFGIAWNKYNYPTSIAGSGETATLSYDGNHQRWRQVYVKGSTTETTIYVGSDLEKVTTGSTVDWRHSIKVGRQTVALYSRLSTGTNTLRFMLEDHQGSPSKITTSTGTTHVSENFTAFGNRRNPATWSGTPTSTDLTNINAVSRQGYTGHDLLGSLGLNHMNGRVQDAITGRFLSADPYITEPGNTQNYNRYSYVYNNPLSFTDPSGFDQENCGWGYSDPCITDGSYGSRSGGGGEEYTGPGTVVPGPVTYLPGVNWEIINPDGSSTWKFWLLVGSDNASSQSLFGDSALGSTGGGNGFGLDDAASLGVGFTPAGTVADLYTAATGNDFFTDEKVTGFWRYAGIVPFVSEARKVGNVLDAVGDEYRLTRTVENGLESRPYLNSPLTIGEIRSTGAGVPDPGGVPGALRYNVSGSFNGSQGTYELVVHPDTNTVYHFLFKSTKK